MKKRVSLFLIFILLLTNIHIGVSHAEIYSDDEYTTLFMSKLYEINAELSKYGLTIDDLKTLPQKDNSFYEEMKEYATESTSPSALTVNTIFFSEIDKENYNDFSSLAKSTNPSSLNASKRWNYAAKIAEINKKRDSNAKDIDTETVYMYMSHFIDIKTGMLEEVDTSISDDGYCSAWITDEDRKAYDTYLSGSKNGELIKQNAQLALKFLSLCHDLKEFHSLDAAETCLKQLQGVSSIFVDSYFTISDFTKAVAITKEATTSKEAVKQMEKAFKEDYSDEYFAKKKTEFFSSLAIAFVCGGLQGVIISLGLSTISLSIDVYKDFFERAWWLALVRANNIRVSYRIMRQEGLW